VSRPPPVVCAGRVWSRRASLPGSA
jgi:hypothetical protein